MAIFEVLLRESPAFALMLGMFYFFLRHLAHRDEMEHESRQETTEALRQTSRAIEQVHEALCRMNGHT